MQSKKHIDFRGLFSALSPCVSNELDQTHYDLFINNYY